MRPTQGAKITVEQSLKLLNRTWYRAFGKRALDLVGSILALMVLSPVIILLLVAYCFRGESPFFLQKRPGKGGKLFTLWKFRTMRDAYPSEDPHSPARVTPLGRWLRKTSLDEIPQLLNVLKGDMSLVGPRPLLVEYLSLYSDEEKRRHQVKPGITGYAQIKGRNHLSWKEKFQLDLYYVENYSFTLDLYILLMTPFALSGTEPSEPYSGEN